MRESYTFQEKKEVVLFYLQRCREYGEVHACTLNTTQQQLQCTLETIEDHFSGRYPRSTIARWIRSNEVHMRIRQTPVCLA